MWIGLKTNVGLYQKTQTISRLRKMTLQRHQSNAKGYINVILIYSIYAPITWCSTSLRCISSLWQTLYMMGLASSPSTRESQVRRLLMFLSSCCTVTSVSFSFLTLKYNQAVFQYLFYFFCWYSIEQCKRRQEAVIGETGTELGKDLKLGLELESFVYHNFCVLHCVYRLTVVKSFDWLDICFPVKL